MDRVIGLISANYASEELGVLTDQRTIASLPYGGRYRLIDFPLSNMVNSGIKTVGIIMPYKYRSIIDHVGAGKEWGLDRKSGGLFILPGSVFGVSNSGHRFLLRDLRRNMVYLKRSQAPYVLMTSTSNVYNVDYREMLSKHIEEKADITILTKKAIEKDEHVKRVIFSKDNKVKSLLTGVKKGDTAFLDVFIINHDLLLDILEWYSAIDYMDLFNALENDLDKLNICNYVVDCYVKGIHTVDEYFRSNMDLLKKETGNNLFTMKEPIVTKVRDSVPSRYVKGSKVANSLIPAGCVIRGTVKDSIFFRDVIVEEGAVVKNSIIMEGCVIKKKAKIENAIIDRNNVIGESMVIKGTRKNIYLKEKKN